MRAASIVLLVGVMTVAGARARAEAAPAARTVLEQLSCTSCHLGEQPTPNLYASFDAFKKAPPPRPTGCVQCHVNNAVAAAAPRPAGWLPLTAGMIERVRRFHAYVQAPAIVTTVLGQPRFTACGLERFLSSPVSRRGASAQSMFSLESGRLRTLLAGLARELEPCREGTAAPAATIARGRELFGRLACASCHTGVGLGPRLRLGYPLLGRAYFGARVRHGVGTREAPPVWQRRWEARGTQLVASGAGAVLMPAYADISDADVDALYAYLGSDGSDVPAPTTPSPVTRVEVTDAIRVPLFREVQKKVFDTTCRHCHSPDASDQSIIASVFGAVKDGAPVELPMTRLGLGPSPTLRRMLSPGPGCSASPLVARLEARWAEWTGQAVPGAPRGMPLTLPPLPRDVIRLVQVWSAAGCPSDRGDLCDACPLPSGNAAHSR